MGRFGDRKVNLGSKTPKAAEIRQNKGEPDKISTGLITWIGLNPERQRRDKILRFLLHLGDIHWRIFTKIQWRRPEVADFCPLS